jgi:hypothetical protein
MVQGTHITEVIRASRRAGNGKTRIRGADYTVSVRKTVSNDVSCGHLKLTLCKNHDLKVMETLI